VIIYPLSAMEERFIRLAERIVVIVAFSVIMVLSAISYASV